MKKNDRGLHNKFQVIRTDGQSAEGGKHAGCQYFVLDITHDPHVKPALLAYAGSCQHTHPYLATDLLQLVRHIPSPVDVEQPIERRMVLQKLEFDALDRFMPHYQRLNRTTIVDDDYPAVRHHYESAMQDLIQALRANGRF